MTDPDPELDAIERELERIAALENARELTPVEIARIALYVNNKEALRRALTLSITRRRRSPLARRLARGDRKAIRHALLEKMRGLRKQLHRIFCVTLDWCRLRKHRLAKLMAGLVRLMLQFIPGTAAAIANAVAMFGDYLLDELCECDQPATPA